MQRGAALFGKSNDFVMNPQSNYQGSRKNKDLNQGLNILRSTFFLQKQSKISIRNFEK